MKKITITTILLLNSIIIFSQSKLNPEQRIDTLFSTYNSNTPGVAVAVVKNGEIIFKKGYGLANMEYDIPITPQTIFHCASVSKQFTAFSIFLLEQRGKLSFSDDIRKYLPEVPDFGKPITIKHLIYHTSGLKEQYGLMTFAGWRMDDVFTSEQILKIVSNQKELNFDPGSQFRYTNTGYALLAEIVARVSGKSFAEFTKENIFEPLGMKNTQFYDDHEKIVKNRAYSYYEGDATYKKSKLNFSDVGATSLFSTVEDLSKWTNNFDYPMVGDTALIKKFNKPATLDNGKPAYLSEPLNIRHAKGQFLRNYRGVNTYIHTGGNAGFRAFLGRYPDNGLTVITLSNDQSFVAYPTSMLVSEFYLENEMQEKPTPDTSESNEDEKRKTKFDTKLSNFIGEYHSNELSTSYFLTTEGQNLIMKHSRLSDIILERKMDLEFSGVNSFRFDLEFIKDKNGQTTGFNVIDFRGEIIKFNKINSNNIQNQLSNTVSSKPVQEQLTAYNARNITAFLEPYSDDIEIYSFPNSLSGKGKEYMRKVYEQLFNESPNLHCELLNRMIFENTVIDHEKVTGFRGDKEIEALAIYKLENNKIRKVYFIMKE